MSDTRNVKLGVCSVTFNGVDLGLTKGGVDVTVKTNTHAVTVDQFGNSTVNEYVMGRTVQVKAPFAETTLDLLNKIMPGSTLANTPGAKASGTMTPTANPVDGDWVSFDGLKITFKTANPTNNANYVVLGGTTALTLTALKNLLAAHADPRAKLANFTASATALTVTYATDGVIGNSYPLAASSSNWTIVQMSGGSDDVKRVDVSTSIGLSLLATAAPLVLHPIANAASNKQDDFIIPLANTAGEVTYSYKVDAERIFSVTFNGYPDPVTGALFSVGDPAAAS
jgi:hypothetical protein